MCIHSNQVRSDTQAQWKPYAIRTHFQLGPYIGKDLTDNNEDTIVDNMQDTIGRTSRSLVLLHC